MNMLQYAFLCYVCHSAYRSIPLHTFGIQQSPDYKHSSEVLVYDQSRHRVGRHWLRQLSWHIGDTRTWSMHRRRDILFEMIRWSLQWSEGSCVGLKAQLRTIMNIQVE